MPTGRVWTSIADLVAELHELVDGGGSVDVGGDQQRLAALLAQPDRQLGGGGGLARALQADQHDHRAAWRVELELVALAAEHLDQLVVDDLDDLLAGLNPVEHFGAERLLTHIGHEVLDDLEVDVRLEQGKADLAQGDVKVGLGDLRLATQAVGDGLQACREGFEHSATDCGGSWRGRAVRPRSGCPF